MGFGIRVLWGGLEQGWDVKNGGFSGHKVLGRDSVLECRGPAKQRRAKEALQ